MIIADEDDALKIKDPPAVYPPVRYPERAASRRSLPDYETSQAITFNGLNDSESTLYKPPPRRRLLDSRVWRAVIASLAVYIFLTIVIGVPIIVHKELEQQQQPPPRDPFSPLSYLGWPDRKLGSPVNNITSPLSPGIYPTCNNWTFVEFVQEGPSSSVVLAVTEHYIPPSGQFSITSNASSSHDFQIVQGAFYAGVNPNETIQDAVLSITMESSSPSVFNRTFVCFALTENFADLSLLTPNDLTSADNILYNITLLFPQTTTPSIVDSFSTFLPMFDQQFGSFDGIVTFGRVSFGGDISRVTVDSIEASRVIVDTSLEPVTGTFHVNTSLEISTVLAPIVANINLYNDPDCQFPTTLDVHTGNSNLTVNVTILAPNKEPPSRPNFVANLRTFSGALSTSFLHDPSSSPSALQVHVTNDLGPVDVTLDSLFQGLFQVSTQQATAYVSQGNQNLPDPWSSGLERTMQIDSNYTARSFGMIGWGSQASPWTVLHLGEVSVTTSLADASLSFLG